MRSLSVLAVVVAATLGAAGVNDSDREYPSAQSMRDSVLSAERRFFAGFLSRWRASGRYEDGSNSIVRYRALRCIEGSDARGAPLHVSKNPNRILKSQRDTFNVCPYWYIEAVQRPDEGVSIDFAIDPEFRVDINASRELLIGILEDAAQKNPADDFVRGQIVRFLVDQAAYDRARDVAEKCGGSAWWCNTLRGYALARDGEPLAAERAYQEAVAAMPEVERCRWQDISPLLDDAGEKRFRGTKCADRDAIVARAWWLSDPLFIEPGNPRLLEHFMRKTSVILRGGNALDRDERYDWREATGGDVRGVMMVRYGSPSFAFWGKDTEDWKKPFPGREYLATAQRPRTSYEYSPGRLHTIPAFAAINDPTHSAASDWFLNDTVTTPVKTVLEERWWPREHFNPARPLIQLHEMQTAFLRRQDVLVFAVAVALPPEALSRMNGSQIKHVYLVRSPVQDSVEVIGDRPGIAGMGAAVWANVPPAPSLFGVEFKAATSFKPGGRTRFGAVPPEPLSALANGKVAISDPVMLRHPADTAELPVNTDSALALMASTNRVQTSGKIGIYWETYGFATSDTMQLAVWIERHTPQGVGRKLTNALQLTRDLNTPIAINWVETPASRRTHVIPGPVRIVGRSMSVDVSGLPSGSYWLDVAATAKGKDIVRGRRVLIVQ